ncbi:MAG: PGF-pre-PGF domain-containing protein, partial [Candidatus Nanoarchaeia archaeon]|nr:PGF-pre-PGF domain-containing protein [Candidatus Nanoarchaeia archaeon]
TVPTIAANATSPLSVYTNTDWNVSITAIDVDAADPLTGYVQFYVNGIANGTPYSNTIVNGASSFVATLGSGNFSKGDNLIAEFWADDGTNTTAKYNTTEITVLNSAPNVVTNGTLTNMTFHNFLITARVQDADGGSDITATNVTQTSGSCVYLNNVTDGNYFNVTYNCSGNALEEVNVSIGFTDSSDEYTQTNVTSTVYPNFFDMTPITLTNPDNVSYHNSEFTFNWTGITDPDNDEVTYYLSVSRISVVPASETYNTTNLSFEPESEDYSEGTWLWNITAYDGYDNGTTSSSRIFTYDITEPTPTNISENDSNIQFGDSVEFSALWNDTTAGLSHYIFGWNNSEVWVNDSAVALTGNNNWSNVSSKTVTAVSGSVVEWAIYVNDSSGNWNDTEIKAFTVNNTAPTIVANATSPSTVYTNTDFNVNVTVIDIDVEDTITVYLQFYINGTASGYEESKIISSNNNTLIATLGNGNFREGYSLNAIFWAGDGTVNTTEYNTSVVNVSSLAPTVQVQNTFVNCSAGHCFNVTAGVVDVDGSSDIIATNISIPGSCDNIENSTDGNYFNSTWNCSGTALASANVIIGFKDAGNNYVQTNLSVNTYPNQLPSQPTLTSPAHGYASNATENVTLNWSASTDADSDTINYYVIVNGTQACYTTGTTNTSCIYETSAVQDYVWNVTPYDGSQNRTTSSSRTFSYDLTRPVVTAVSSSSVTSSGATLTATTDENATCAYSTNDINYTNMTAFTTTGTTSHSEALSGLSSSTLYTYYVRCIDVAGNIMNFSNSTAFTTTAASSGGGGGGGGSSSSETKIIGSVTAGTTKELTFYRSETHGVTGLQLTFNNSVSSPRMEIKPGSFPPGAPALSSNKRKVYQYISFTPTRIEENNLNKAVITFKVRKSWVLHYGFEKNTIRLHRYNNNRWNELKTTYLSEDSYYYYYNADSPGFSTFAITGEQKTTTTTIQPKEEEPVQQQEPVEETVPQEPAVEQDQPEQKTQEPVKEETVEEEVGTTTAPIAEIIIILLIIIFLGVLGYLVFAKKHSY